MSSSAFLLDRRPTSSGSISGRSEIARFTVVDLDWPSVSLTVSEATVWFPSILETSSLVP